MTSDSSGTRYRSLKEFYPFYLSEHQDTTCRVLHFIGTGLIAGWIALAVVTGNAWWLLLVPLGGYGFAWVGHFFFEKNTPATFQYPGYSLVRGHLNIILRTTRGPFATILRCSTPHIATGYARVSRLV